MSMSQDGSSFFDLSQNKAKPLMSGYLWRKPPKKSKFGGWQKRFFVLTSDGKFSQAKNKMNSSLSQTNLTRSHLSMSVSQSNLDSNAVNSSMFLQQRTKIYSSEFRENCFEICTPAQRKIILAAATPREKLDWMHALETGCRNAPPRTIKICIVGNDKDMQQKLLYAFFMECGQQKLASDVLNYSYRADNVELTLNMEVTREKVKLVLCCVCEKDYPKLRVLNYVDANAFMMCYAANQISQFEAIESVWYPEVKPSVEKGASLFLVGLHGKEESEEQVGVRRGTSEEGGEIDRLVGEELARFLDANFFDVDLDYKSDDVQKEADISSTAGMAMDKSEVSGEFDSPAETFLDVLQATIEDADGSIIDDESASTDVANLDDFNTSALNLGPINFAKRISFKPKNFLQFVRTKTNNIRGALASSSSRMRSMRLRGSSLGDDRSKLDAETIGALRKLKQALRNLKPKAKKKPKKKRVDEDEKDRADFVSRHLTGSLIFLGEGYLDDDDARTQGQEE